MLDTAFEAMAGPLLNPLCMEEVNPLPIFFPDDFAALAVLDIDFLIPDSADVAFAPMDPKLEFTDVDAADRVFMPFAVCCMSEPLREIFPIPIATAPRLFAIDPIDNPEIILIPSATLLNPVPAFFADSPTDLITLEIPSSTLRNPPLIAPMTVLITFPNAVNPVLVTVSDVPSIKSPAPAVVAPTPTASNPAPSTIHPAPATAAPAPNTIMLAPSDAIATAPAVPYCTTVGRTPATTANDAAANNAPAPTSTIAAPNAINPTAPAVIAGPTAPAIAINAPTATTIPAIQAIAGVPAFASAILAAAMIVSPAATNTTAAPIAKNATDVADSCAGATDTLFNIAVSPSPINAKAPTIPIITPIATPPELASAIADPAIIPKPAAIVSTPTPSIMNAFAACIVCL